MASDSTVVVFSKIVESLYELKLISASFKNIVTSEFSPGSVIITVKNFGEAQNMNKDLIALELLNK